MVKSSITCMGVYDLLAPKGRAYSDVALTSGFEVGITKVLDGMSHGDIFRGELKALNLNARTVTGQCGIICTCSTTWSITMRNFCETIGDFQS